MHTYIIRSGFISINKFRFYVKLIAKSIGTETAFLNALSVCFPIFLFASHFDFRGEKGGEIFCGFNSFKIPYIFY